MKQKHSHYRACSADHGLSIPCCTRKHQQNPPQNKLFQQPASVPLLTDDSQIGANLRVCADEENRADFDQRS
jgi:hypothetical protein